MVGNAGVHQDAHFVKQIDFSKTTEDGFINIELEISDFGNFEVILGLRKLQGPCDYSDRGDAPLDPRRPPSFAPPSACVYSVLT